MITGLGFMMRGLRSFLSVDPLTKSYPMLTPYQFASNSPILNIDIDGLEALSANEIVKTFADGKTAISYKMTIYVDQPGQGKDRDTWERDGLTADVGHTFVRLEKVNKDKSIVSVTFGFYPSKSMNPLMGEIQSKGVIQNNEDHQYDVKKEIPLTKDKFDKALNFVKSKDGINESSIKSLYAKLVVYFQSKTDKRAYL